MMADIIGTIFNDDGVFFPALFGTPDADTLDGLQGADVMHGGDGDDIYFVDNVGDTVSEFFNDALGGHDVVNASASHKLGFGIEDLNLTGSAHINGTGNENNNVINGNSGKNTLDGKAGIDTMDGGDGSDTYIVDNKLDKVGEQFNDALGGVDLVKSSVSYVLSHMDKGIENLTLTGSAHINGTGNGNHNVITGNSGNNILMGLAGNDQLIGNGGNDKLDGGSGNDKLTGGSGKDQLTGGTGHDKFAYKSVSDSPAGTGRDVITDFKGNGTAIGDQIDLAAIDANILKSGNQAFTWKGATPGGAGTLWYTGGVLHGNIDGDAPAEFQIQLTGAPALVASDILL
jgi:Ca2+-binding RTX toxin-like protein